MRVDRPTPPAPRTPSATESNPAQVHPAQTTTSVSPATVQAEAQANVAAPGSKWVPAAGEGAGGTSKDAHPITMPPAYTSTLKLGMEDEDGTPTPDEAYSYEESVASEWDTSINRQGRIDVSLDLSTAVSTSDLAALKGVEGHEIDLDTFSSDSCPALNIVIFIVGSRGDVQPYVALALELIKTRGHRVRIATHATFAAMVDEASVALAGLTDSKGEPLTGRLEHFNIGGSPEELMSYMVKNPGLVPGLSSLANGDIRRKRKMVKQMLQGCYLACFSNHERTKRPFAADAIISNPPAFAHIHVAEALGIPLLMSFTMPWTPTSAFPHPLVAAKSSHSDKSLNNYSSFVLADALMWQGLGDLINHFRYSILGLRPLNVTRGPLVLQRLQIPYTYAWSEHLLPKPADWKGNTDVVGFYSLKSDTSRVKPDAELVKFLAAGPAPIYVGFGSVVIEKPELLTNIILNAVERTGVRALVSAGWADLGSTGDIPDSVFIIKGNVPHDWLFDEGRVSAVCHHGGAGTTCAGLRHGLPTIIVPFFGDQWFWGNAVNHAGAGPAPIPFAELTVDQLAEAIEVALAPATREAAQKIGKEISAEDGVKQGVDSFHRHLPLLNMRCDVDKTQVAVWWSEAFQARISAGVAAVLVEERSLSWRDLVPHRAIDYDATRHYTDPFASFGQSVLNLGAMSIGSTGELFYAPARGLGGLVWGVPKASFDVVSSLQEGLENVPGLMGAQSRRRGKVDSFTSGVEEGAKGMAFGLYDGITGLVTEPLRGAKTGGVDGFIKGSWNGLVSIGPRLAGAGLGLVVHPATGAFRGLRTSLSKRGILENDSVMSSPRQAVSHAEGKRISKQQRNSIIGAWARLCAPAATEARREEHEARHLVTERQLLAHETEPLSTYSGSAGMGQDTKGKGKRREGSGSSASASAPVSNETGMPWYTPQVSVEGVLSMNDKDPRWAQNDNLAGSGLTESTRETKRDFRHPVRSNTGASFASGSTADIAMAGTERWGSASTTTDDSTVLQTPGTSVVGSAEGRATPKKTWRGGRNKGRN